jgi:cytochrome c553
MMNYRLLVLLAAFLATSPLMAAGDAVAGQEKSKACASCHGADGKSPSPAFPTLAGQYEDYLLNALRQYKKGERKNPVMAGMVAGLSDQDMADLAAYYASQDGLHDTTVGAFDLDK